MIDLLPVSLLDWLVSGLVVLLVVLVLFSLLRRIWRGKPGRLYVQKLMFTPEGATALTLLEQAAGSQLRVFPSVPMTEVLALSPELGKAHRETAWQDMFGEKLDFVLCSPKELRVRLVVALVDDSLSQADGRHRHTLLARIEDTGLPVLHLSPKDWPTPAELRDELQSLLKPAEVTPPLPGGRQEPVPSLPDDEHDDEPRFRL